MGQVGFQEFHLYDRVVVFAHFVNHLPGFPGIWWFKYVNFTLLARGFTVSKDYNRTPPYFDESS